MLSKGVDVPLKTASANDTAMATVACAARLKLWHVLFEHKGQREGTTALNYADIVALLERGRDDVKAQKACILKWWRDFDKNLGAKIMAQGEVRKPGAKAAAGGAASPEDVGTVSCSEMLRALGTTTRKSSPFAGRTSFNVATSCLLT